MVLKIKIKIISEISLYNINLHRLVYHICNITTIPDEIFLGI